MNSFVPNNASKIVCIGRNYAEHAAELNNPVSQEPLLFIKPTTTICPLAGDIYIPKSHGEVHYELEIAFVIGSELKKATSEEVLHAISGIGLALDLTLRDVQTQLKEKQQPWEKAKSFDGACPIECLPYSITKQEINNLSLSLIINGETRQKGGVEKMLFKPTNLIAYISQWFTLSPGDIVLTGTPAGVGVLQTDDTLKSALLVGDNALMEIDSHII